MIVPLEERWMTNQPNSSYWRLFHIPPTAAETKYRGARIAFQGTIHIDADAGTDIIGAEKEDGVGACIKPSQVQERFFPGAGLPGSVLRPVADRMTEPSPQRPR